MRAALPLVFLAAVSAAAFVAAAAPTAEAQNAPQTAECLTSGSGEKACGYHCLSAFGSVRCAQTAAGVCSAASDILSCWDPPGLVRVVAEAQAKRTGTGGRTPPSARSLARPTCVTAAGKTACGYHCLTGFDQVQCANTPWGICRAGEGAIACWDPPAAVVASFRDATRIPEPTCSTTSGQIACGYQCAATGGKVQCTQTPEGTCRAEQDKVTCFDPPPESRGVVFDGASAVACMESGASPRLCGHHCVASSRRLACASTERGVCLESKGELGCR